MDVNGIEGGSPQLQKTVLPVVAEANLSMRLAPGQEPDVVVPELERLLREAAPAGADVEVDLWSSAPPGLIPPDSPAIRLGQDAFERALGTRPLLLRAGGTLPIVPALADRGIPTIVTGFDLPGGQHPLAERAPTRRARPARRRRRAGALHRARPGCPSERGRGPGRGRASRARICASPR